MDFQKCALAPDPTFPLSMRREKKTPIIDADNDDEIGQHLPNLKSQSLTTSKEIARTARLSDFTPVVIEVTPKLLPKDKTRKPQDDSEKTKNSIQDLQHFKSMQPTTKSNNLILPAPQIEPITENSPKLALKLPLSLVQPIEDGPDKKQGRSPLAKMLTHSQALFVRNDQTNELKLEQPEFDKQSVQSQALKQFGAEGSEQDRKMGGTDFNYLKLQLINKSSLKTQKSMSKGGVKFVMPNKTE